MYFSVLNFEYGSVLVSGKDNEDLFWRLFLSFSSIIDGEELTGP